MIDLSFGKGLTKSLLLNTSFLRLLCPQLVGLVERRARRSCLGFSCLSRGGDRRNAPLGIGYMSFPFKCEGDGGLGGSRRCLSVPRRSVPILGPGEVHLWGWFFAGRRDTCAIVRRIAGGYLGCMPGEVCLKYLPGGKPHFEREGPHFSLSHTGGMVLAAFAWFFIGLDIEKDSRSVSVSKIATRYFHSSECL